VRRLAKAICKVRGRGVPNSHSAEVWRVDMNRDTEELPAIMAELEESAASIEKNQ
jgi:hypothetical protein